MFRKIWQRVTRSDDPVSLSASTAGENRREPSIDFPNAEHLPFYWLDRSTGASHLIETPGELVNLHIYHGDIYYQNRDFFEALLHFDEAIRVIFGTSYPGQKYAAAALTYGKRGNVYFNTGNYDKAIEDYGRAIKLEPDIFAASLLYVSRGKAYIRKDDPDKSIQDLDTAISLGARSAEAHFDRGHAYTNKGEFGKAMEDFGKAIELDSDFVTTYLAGVDGGGRDDHTKTCSPHEIIGKIRENNIGLGVIKAVSAIRSHRGLPEALGNSTLGMAAMRLSFDLAGSEMSPEQVKGEFSQRIRENEYSGWVIAPYYREVWPMDAADEEIIVGMADVLCRQVDDVAYEDFGLGITHGYPNNDHSDFGVCIVMGFGCTDGSAYALARINEVRESAGVAPLEPLDSLRSIVRKYISMEKEPDADQFDRDMRESGYAGNAVSGMVVRQGYSGAYASIPEGIDVHTYEDTGKLAASGLIRDHRDNLLRSDWQHVGIATRLVNHPTHGRSVQAEIITAWQLPESLERPDHFPPPLDATTTDAL